MNATSSFLGGQLDRLTLGDAVLVVAVLVGVMAVVRRAWPWLRRFVAFVNALVGEDPRDVAPGQQPRLGVLARLSAVEVTAATGAEHAERAGDAAERAADSADRAAHAAERAADAAEDAAKQLHPNGGSSTRDRLDQIATAVGAAPDPSTPPAGITP